jgi:hypothetical protein
MHPTTAVWFGIWIAAALAVSDRRLRAPIAGLAVMGVLATAWAVTSGPLRGHLTRMDPLWASALAGKDYVFPSDWNGSFWLVNLAYLGVAVALFSVRHRGGLALPREPGLVAGAAALVVVFLLSWPLMLADIALAIQLQTSRVFWLLDFLAAIYLAWWLSSFNSAGPHPRGATRKSTFRYGSVAKAVTAIVIALAVGRGVFVWRVEHAGSPLVQIGLPRDSWTDAMQWIARTPPGSHVLADPGHAWKYGTSVRVSGERDVFLEEVKDLALALYSRDVAVEALRRIDAAKDFDGLTPEQLRALARTYDLDYLVAERDLALPVVYRNDRFRVYALVSP